MKDLFSEGIHRIGYKIDNNRDGSRVDPNSLSLVGAAAVELLVNAGLRRARMPSLPRVSATYDNPLNCTSLIVASRALALLSHLLYSSTAIVVEIRPASALVFRPMPETAFHYEQRRLENDLVALEIFDVRIALAKDNLANYLVAKNSRRTLRRSDQSQSGCFCVRRTPNYGHKGRFHARTLPGHQYLARKLSVRDLRQDC